MTGTPVQNSLNDFASLLEFLRIHPFEEPSAFDEMIQKPWKEGNVEEATERIKRLVQCIVLRRLKTTIQLPDRYDIFQYVDFTAEEHAFYRQVSCPVEEMLDHLAHQQVTERGQFLSVIQRINILRMICNLGDTDISPSFQLTEPAGPSVEPSLRKTTAQSIFESLVSLGQAVCVSVVFSFWTRSLDMVQRALQISGIDTVRFDGRVSARDRKKALERFRNDPQVRVMLITTSCGAVGYDLIAPFPAASTTHS
ncbi:hypothetical protein SLS55_007111 [Diplodia seriata]|uniref:Helicase C-terminal domain-containing protein n=1 Tax=Diplodia seriata TaxID=420778 RepID=A0ABR3CBC9_9PEZI